MDWARARARARPLAPGGPGGVWDYNLGLVWLDCLQRLPYIFPPISLFCVTSSTFYLLLFYLPQRFPLYSPLYPTTTIKYHYPNLLIIYYHFLPIKNQHNKQTVERGVRDLRYLQRAPVPFRCVEGHSGESGARVETCL
jgi:hypothetical protein